MLNALLKKQFQEDFSFMKQNRKNTDWWGMLLSIVLTLTIIGVVVFIFFQFVKIYTAVQIDGVLDLKARQYELLTLTYTLIMVANIFSGTRAIKLAIFDNADMKLYKVMPISPNALFISKFISIYIKQVVFCLISVLPINLTFGVVMETGVGYIFSTVFICLLMPFVTLLFSALLSLPVFIIRKAIRSRYVLALIVLTILTAVVFWGYTEILQFFKNLISSGDIRFFFNEQRMFAIIKAVKYLYPSNVFASLAVGLEVGKNVGILVAIVLLFGAGSFVCSHLMFKVGLQLADGGNTKATMISKNNFSKKHKPWVSFLQKEIVTVIRTPSYAFSYFSISVIMPLMVFFCTKMTSELIGDMALIDCDLQITLTVVLLFTVLCNTFCATNISREGKAFFTLKTMPIDFKQILRVKIGFCSVISVLATLISVIAVSACGYVSVQDGVFVFFSATLFGEAQILFATRKDFNRPRFFDDGIDATESSSTASALVLVGTLIALLLGVSSLIFAIFRGLIEGQSVALFTYLNFSLIPLLFFVVSLIYLLVGLDKKYEEISENI